jgi:5-methylcytosine-specific restriction endonuclease McrA
METRKEKARERAARYRAKHREKACELAARWYVENRERALNQQRRRRAENPEKMRATHARYYAAHTERQREYDARYRAENREKLREVRALRHAKNPQRARERALRWRIENPEKAHAGEAKKRAVKAGATIGTPETLREFFKWARAALVIPCWWCGIITVPGRKRHVDHANPLSRGGKHSIENLYVVCESCNLTKHDRSLVEWLISTSQRKGVGNVGIETYHQLKRVPVGIEVSRLYR